MAVASLASAQVDKHVRAVMQAASGEESSQEPSSGA
jgi:hypothetical protein